MKNVIKKILKEEVDNKKINLDGIVDFLVDDTIIDFKENKIYFRTSPILLYIEPFPLFSAPWRLPNSPFGFSFSKYCRDNYGLTENEMDYVWKEYTKIISVKINDDFNNCWKCGSGKEGNKP